MKIFTLLIMVFLSLSAIAQTDSTYQRKLTTDSLNKRFELLEKGLQQMRMDIKTGGSAIQTGTVLIGVGTFLGIAGGIVAGVAKPNTTTSNGRTVVKPSTLQYVGFGITGGGFVLSIAGLAKIGVGGAWLRDL